MKTAFASILWLCAILFVPAGAENAEPDPLGDKPLAGLAYDSFDKAIQALEKASGFKVTYSPDTAKVARAAWDSREHSTFHGPNDTIKEALQEVSRDFALDWKYNPQDKTVTLTLPWYVSDPRSSADLFHAIWNPGAVRKMDAEAIWTYRFSVQRLTDPIPRRN